VHVWEKKLGLALFGASLMLVINAMVVMSNHGEQGNETRFGYLKNSIAAESSPVGNTHIQRISPRSSRYLN